MVNAADATDLSYGRRREACGAAEGRGRLVAAFPAPTRREYTRLSVLIGFSCPDFTILGADGRGISVDDSNDVDDNCQKLFKTGFGVISGAGRTDVIYAVTHRFKDQ